MKLVIDTNRIIASLIKDNISRKILLNKQIQFICPDYSLIELLRHKKEIVNKAQTTEQILEILLSLLFEHIEIIPNADYQAFL